MPIVYYAEVRPRYFCLGLTYIYLSGILIKIKNLSKGNAMDKFVVALIDRLAYIFGNTRALNPFTSVLRISSIHPVYANIECPAMPRLRINTNFSYDACERFKARCESVAFFPGLLENGFPLRTYPIYLVVPWNAPGAGNSLDCMRGLVLFNRVVGPDPVHGPQLDNEMGQWGAILMKDETALKNLPYQEHDRSLALALGKNWRDLSWLRSLLQEKHILYRLKS